MMKLNAYKRYKRRLYKRRLLGALLLFLAAAHTGTADAAVNFDALKEAAPDAVAWVQIPDTLVNYPVVQGMDNKFYLARLPDGRTSDNGSIFMDFRNAPDFTSKNTVIHGHRMKGGQMFGALRNYVLQAYYDKHPIVLLFTPQGDYKVLLFAGYSFDHSEESFPLMFESDATFMDYVTKSRERSVFVSDVEVVPEDQIVTLITCDVDYDDGRLILMGRLLK